jgi:tRNA(adenine34) deaminase
LSKQVVFEFPQFSSTIHKGGAIVKRFISLLVSTVLAISISACQSSTSLHATSEACKTSATRPVITPVQEERDNIYMLLAYSVVLKDWQQKGAKQRGHNIGSILVDQNGKVVFWARNSNMVTGNGTQHGEVRLMIGYLDKVKSYSLKGYTIYTSLEPCAMCSGMMTLQSVTRTVYGQADPGYGKALERLSLDTHELPELLPKLFDEGYCPYPRGVISDPSKTDTYQQLNSAYKKAGGSITDFLLTDEARKIYENAQMAFLNFHVKYQENEEFLKNAIDFLNNQVTTQLTPQGQLEIDHDRTPQLNVVYISG